MHVCMHACMHVMYSCIDVYVYICIYELCIFVYTHIFIHIRVYIHLHTCRCIHVYVYACMHACIHTCMHASTYVRTHARTYVRDIAQLLRTYVPGKHRLADRLRHRGGEGRGGWGMGEHGAITAPGSLQTVRTLYWKTWKAARLSVLLWSSRMAKITSNFA